MNQQPSTQASLLSVEQYIQIARDALNDTKAKDIVEIDVQGQSNVTDAIVIASGTSSRHVKALADTVAEEAKKHGIRPLGIEGENDSEWVLIDLGLIVVHVMLPAIRQFYDLESLWRNPKSNPSQLEK